MTSFIKAMSWKPVLDKKDPTQLSAHVQKLMDKLESQGKDPLTAMQECAGYLSDHICQLTKERSRKSFVIRCKDYHKIGTKAWYEYMLRQVQQIMGVLANRKLDQMLKVPVT